MFAKQRSQPRRKSSHRGRRLRVERCESRLLLAGDSLPNDIVVEADPTMQLAAFDSFSGSTDVLLSVDGIFGDLQTWLAFNGGDTPWSPENPSTIDFDLLANTIALDSFKADGLNALIIEPSTAVQIQEAVTRGVPQSAGDWLPPRAFLPPAPFEPLPLLPPVPSVASSIESVVSVNENQNEQPEELSQHDTIPLQGLVSLTAIFDNADPAVEKAEAARAAVFTASRRDEVTVPNEVVGDAPASSDRPEYRMAHVDRTRPDGLWALDFAFAEEDRAIEPAKELTNDPTAEPASEVTSSVSNRPQANRDTTVSNRRRSYSPLNQQDAEPRFADEDIGKAKPYGLPAIVNAGYSISSSLIGATLIARVWLGACYPRRDRARTCLKLSRTLIAGSPPPARRSASSSSICKNR